MAIRKTAVTGYGMVGTDYVRVTLAILSDGTYTFVRADGSNAIVPFAPSTFRTSGDVVSVAATMVDTLNMAAFNAASLPAHGWKGEYTLAEFIEKMDPKHIAAAELLG